MDELEMERREEFRREFLENERLQKDFDYALKEADSALDISGTVKELKIAQKYLENNGWEITLDELISYYS